MNKQTLLIIGFIIVIFSLGIFVGDRFNENNGSRGIEAINNNARTASQVNQTSDFSIPNPLAVSSINVDDEKSDYSVMLDNKITNLEARVFELEQTLTLQSEVIEVATPSITETRFQQMNNQQTITSLLKAGIDEAIAADIIHRRSDIELKKLELYDRAIRDNYINTTQYQSELLDITAGETTLRDELGDEAYDFYLFANRQANRVKAISVMMGSNAEQAGLKDGDLIVQYGQHRIFEWAELKNATSEGVLGEYVHVDIMRDNQLISLSVPRGPLGVRLGTARISP